MSQFTTRVVLYGNASWLEYDELHKQMAARGFTDEITSNEGVTYKMPDAEYDYTGDDTREQVRLKAKAAADTVKRDNNAVFVTEVGSGRCWHGLMEVRRQRRA